VPGINEERGAHRNVARTAWKERLTAIDVAPQSGTVGAWSVIAGLPRADGGISVLVQSAEWLLAAVCGFVNGDLVLTEATIRPVDTAPSNGLSGTVLRSIPVAAIVAEARRQAIAAPDEFAAIPAEVGLMTSEALIRIKGLANKLDTTAMRRGGRRGFPPDFYRGVAIDYLELQGAGKGRGILVEIARLATGRLGRPVTRENARDWVRRATELKYLSAGIPGKAGRLPGPNLFNGGSEGG
jgi:hypothetical protein